MSRIKHGQAGLSMGPRRVARRFLGRHGLTSQSGVVSVELAFVMSFLLVMAFGAFDFGRAGFEKMRVISAARAGAQYGIQNQSAAANVQSMIAAARDDANDSTQSLTTTARRYCSCPGAGELICTATCGDGKYPLMYVEVSVSNDIAFWFHYPGVPDALTVSATSTLRVR